MDAEDPLRDIVNEEVSGYPLCLASRTEGRFSEEDNFRVTVRPNRNASRGEVLVTGKFFRGRGHYSSWFEISHRRIVTFSEGEKVDFRETGGEAELLQLFVGALSAGDHIMVAYSDHSETRRALEIGVPPEATPIGHYMFLGGCTWFKDWYIAEGFAEGDQKLQGERPATADRLETHRETLLERCRDFLEKEHTSTPAAQAKHRARQVIQMLSDPGELHFGF